VLRRLTELTFRFPIYVVGGAVRDIILGRGSNDYDLLIPKQDFPSHLAQMTALLGKKPFVLHEESDIWRYLCDETVIDVAPLHGTLAEDLERRDFTVNSMAMELKDFVAEDHGAIIDYHRGREHLAEQSLVLTGSTALSADALRILRAGRLIAELGFSPSSELHAKALLSAPLLRQCPGERVWSELTRLTVAPFASSAYTWLEKVGALAVLFPEFAAERGVLQNQYHSFCVYEHSWRAFLGYLEVWASPKFAASAVRERLTQELAQLPANIETVCKLGALLHDIGKPRSKGLRLDGKVTFYRHEQIGVEMLPPLTQRLRLSSMEAKLLTRFVRWHTYLAQLARQPRLHEGHLYRMARRMGTYSVPLSLFSVADLLAKGEEMWTDPAYTAIVTTLNQFLTAWYFRHDEIIQPTLPLSPLVLAEELGLTPGRWLQESVTFLEEQAARGKVKSKEQMILLARQYYANMDK